MNFEVSGQLLVHLAKKYILRVILLSVLIGIGMSYVSVTLKDNTYSSSGELVQSDSNYGLISSYQQFVLSKRFKNSLNNEVKKSTWKNYSHNTDYSVQITSGNNGSTPFFTLNAISEDKQFSKFLTNKSIEILVSSIGKYLSGSNITVVSNATDAKQQSVKSRVIKWFIYGFVGSFILSTIICVFRFLFVGKTTEDDFISIVLNAKKLGTIKISEATK
ncbi:hypothetical protein [Lactiplantibacillus paraxiangfangensis]|uniref:hypothetical protein n=1 Tax=Lactiplantibacillus paraxiangfangensis TaxID=3076224 RepID=UPI0030C6EDE4